MTSTVCSYGRATARLFISALVFSVLSCPGMGAPRTQKAQAHAGGGSIPPATSKASPDILGIKLGVSTADDVHRILKAFPLTEERNQVIGRSALEPQAMVPGQYLVAIHASSPRPCPSDCERIDVFFAPPPNHSVALSLYRDTSFTAGPSFAVLLQSLVAKYGEPGFQNRYSDQQITLGWGWSADGGAVRLTAQHPCWNPRGLDDNSNATFYAARDIDSAAAALKAGCAAAVYVMVQLQNGVVIDFTTNAVNESGIYNAFTRTAQYATDYIAGQEKQQRDKAAKTPAPRL